MPDYTPHLNLELAASSDFYNRPEVDNKNYEKIDIGVKEASEKIDTTVEDHNTSPAAHPYTNEKLPGVENVGEALTVLAKGKVDKAVRIPEGTDLNNMVEEGLYYSNGEDITQTLLNLPNGVKSAVSLQVLKVWWKEEGVAQILIEHLHNGVTQAMFIRANSSSWHDWQQLAVVDSNLKWNDFPYINGYTGEGSQGLAYSKTASGVVHLNGIFSRNTAVQANQVIGVLPVAYRPTRLLSLNASIINTLVVGVIHLTTSGTLVWNSQKIPTIEANQKIQIDVRFSASS